MIKLMLYDYTISFVGLYTLIIIYWYDWLDLLLSSLMSEPYLRPTVQAKPVSQPHINPTKISVISIQLKI